MQQQAPHQVHASLPHVGRTTLKQQTEDKASTSFSQFQCAAPRLYVEFQDQNPLQVGPLSCTAKGMTKLFFW